MISHEIKNSLNCILGYSTIISSEKLNDNLTDHVKKLSSAGVKLKMIVTNILDFSYLEAGKLELATELLSLKEVMKNCEKELQHLKLNEDIKIVYIVPENLPEFILGDALRIQQILNHLISNAIKFTKKGSIKISLKIISETVNDVKIVFEVVDTGIGMSKKQYSGIFEQKEFKNYKTFRSASLGLAIVKKLVKVMKGRVAVRSELGVGTYFSVELPFSKVLKLQKQVKVVLHKSDIIDLKHKKILVADDDLLNKKMLSHILNKQNATVSLVSDGLEALSILKRENFDLVLLDINMPNMTGEELMLQKQQFKTYNSNTPFFALTANNNTEDIEQYFALGFSNVISKPYAIPDFVEKIKMALLG
jgi:CheY-like chemotaxis protein